MFLVAAKATKFFYKILFYEQNLGLSVRKWMLIYFL